MSKKILLLIAFLVIKLSLFAQIDSSLKKSVIEIFKQTAEQRVRDFYSDLDLIGDQDINNVERTYIINQIVNSLFGDKQVYVFNDIALNIQLPEYVESETYLHNVKLYFGNSDVAFEIDSLVLSDVYLADDFYFIKVEVQREMTVRLDKKLVKDVKNLDFYLRLVPDSIDCKLYSIKPHQDNGEEFKKVKIEEVLGSFIIKSVPSGATVTSDELPNLKGVTTYEFKDFKPGSFNINLNKTGFYPVTTTITIEGNKKIEKEIHLDPIIKEPIKDDPRIKEFRRKQVIWLSGAGLTAVAGGYFKYSADKKYKEYLNSTDSGEANDLQQTVKLYDKLTIGFFSLTAVCSVGFTITTVKKGKTENPKKNSAQFKLNGQGAQFTYNF